MSEDYFDQYHRYQSIIKHAKEYLNEDDFFRVNIWWWFCPKRWKAFEIRISKGMNYRYAFNETKKSTRKEIKLFIDKK